MPIAFPTDHLLRSPQRKISRALIHVNALERSVVGYMAKQTPAHKSDDPEGGLVLTAPGNREQWGVRIGDIVTNLRASLDHIAWALAMKRVEETGKSLAKKQEQEIYFPIRNVPHKKPLIGGLSRRDVHYFPAAAHSAIEKFQPYNRSARPELDHLSTLVLLSNFDKHRVVTQTTTGTAMTLGIRRIDHSQNQDGSKMKNQVVPIVKSRVTVHVGDKRIPIGGFRAIHNLIRDEILPAFSEFFK